MASVTDKPVTPLRVVPPSAPRTSLIEDSLGKFITVTAFLLFVGTVGYAAAAALVSPEAWSRTKEILQIALPAETGLTGAVVGFYFGTHKG